MNSINTIKIAVFALALILFAGPDSVNYAKRDSLIENDLEDTPFYIQKPDPAVLLDAWNQVNVRIEGERLSREERRRTQYIIIPLLRDHFLDTYGREAFTDSELAFPIRGGHLSDVGGKNGSGYRSRHHAHDIFVKDINYDCLNDATGEPYYALAMRPAVVLSVHEGWQPTSELTGGNYVWLYNPAEGIFLYYAHLDSIIVRPG